MVGRSSAGLLGCRLGGMLVGQAAGQWVRCLVYHFRATANTRHTSKYEPKPCYYDNTSWLRTQICALLSFDHVKLDGECGGESDDESKKKHEPSTMVCS